MLNTTSTMTVPLIRNPRLTARTVTVPDAALRERGRPITRARGEAPRPRRLDVVAREHVDHAAAQGAHEHRRKVEADRERGQRQVGTRRCQMLQP